MMFTPNPPFKYTETKDGMYAETADVFESELVELVVEVLPEDWHVTYYFTAKIRDSNNTFYEEFVDTLNTQYFTMGE